MDIKMSTSVYLKNFTVKLLKTITSKAIDNESLRICKIELSFLISIFTTTVLSPLCLMRFKHNIT